MNNIKIPRHILTIMISMVIITMVYGGDGINNMPLNSDRGLRVGADAIKNTRMCKDGLPCKGRWNITYDDLNCTDLFNMTLEGGNDDENSTRFLLPRNNLTEEERACLRMKRWNTTEWNRTDYYNKTGFGSIRPRDGGPRGRGPRGGGPRGGGPRGGGPRGGGPRGGGPRGGRGGGPRGSPRGPRGGGPRGRGPRGGRVGGPRGGRVGGPRGGRVGGPRGGGR